MKIQKRLRLFSATRVSYWPRVTFFALTLLCLIMLSVQMGAPNAYAGFRILFMDTINPVLSFTSSVTQGISETVTNLTDISSLRSENARLMEENRQLKAAEQTAEKLTDENAQLRRMLQVVPEKPAKFITARIISDTSNGLVRSLIINGGRNQNIKRGQAVLAEGNFIGRVQDVADDASRVILITDFASKIPVIAGPSSQQGILSGDNSDVIELLYIGQPQSVNPGDDVLTSGKGGGLPAGLPVGKVARWNGTEFSVIPNADLAGLRYVQVADFGLASMIEELAKAVKSH